MLIYFIVLYTGYWAQTDWNGDSGQIQWVDSSCYFASEYLDNKRIQGAVSLFAPSGVWRASKPLSVYRVNKIVFGVNGDIYVGGGFDSTYVFKLGNFGDTLLARKVLVKDNRSGEVTALFYHPDGRVFLGTEKGDVFMSNSGGLTYQHILFLNAEIQSIYRLRGYPWMYIGVKGGVIRISKTDGGEWDAGDTARVPNTQNVYTILEGSPTLKQVLYAGTRSTTDNAQIFKSINDGATWTLLYTFPDAKSAYSIVEDIDHNLYVSTGSKGALFRSSNGCSSWVPVPSPWASADFYNIITDSMRNLYVGGECLGMTKVPKGMVFRSKDKGISWDTIFKPSGSLPTTILSLAQTNEGFLVAGGDTGVVFTSGYCDSGWLISSIYDAYEFMPSNRSLAFWKVSFDVEGRGELKVRVRSSWDIDSLENKNWGNPVPSDSNPVEYGGAYDGDRYIQYKLEFSSDSQFYAPLLSDICVKYLIDIEGPEIAACTLYEGEHYDSNIDWDDYIIIKFNESTNRPQIGTSNIDSILRLSDGHSWRSDGGKGVIKKPGEWISPDMLKISLSTLKIGAGEGYPPTISMGDTIYPDSSTIQDIWGNYSWRPYNGIVGIEEIVGTNSIRASLRITPNPVSKIVEIRYLLPQDDKVKLSIYDIGGRLIKKLVDGKTNKGEYSIKISGQELNSGIYFIRYEIGENTKITKKLVYF